MLLALSRGISILVGLAQPKDMADDLRANTSLGAQTRNSDKTRQDTPNTSAGVLIPGIGEQARVVAIEDVDGQVGVGQGQLVEQLALEAEVDLVPEGSAVALAGLDVGGGELARRRPGERRRHLRRQAAVEGPQRVDRPRDPVERDALQPDLADQLRVLRRRPLRVPRVGQVEYRRHGFGAVERC